MVQVVFPGSVPEAFNSGVPENSVELSSQGRFKEILSRVRELISMESDQKIDGGVGEGGVVDGNESSLDDAVEFIEEVMAALLILFPSSQAVMKQWDAASLAGNEVFSFSLEKGSPPFERFVNDVMEVFINFLDEAGAGERLGKEEFSKLALKLAGVIKDANGEGTVIDEAGKSPSSKSSGGNGDGAVGAVKTSSTSPGKRGGDAPNAWGSDAGRGKSSARMESDKSGRVDFVRIKDVVVRKGDSEGAGGKSQGDGTLNSNPLFSAHGVGEAQGKNFESVFKGGGTLKPGVGTSTVDTGADRVSFPSRSLALELEPPELGKLFLDLSVKDGVLKASVRVETQSVKDLFSAALPHIKKALEEMGIKPGEFHLSTRDESRNFFTAYQQGRNESRGNRGKNPFLEYYNS